jgi:predicted nucleotidyltransferase
MSIEFNKAKALLMSHREHLSRLGTRHLAIFGSTARNETQNSSDIDILVDFDAKKGLFVFVDLKFYLENILKCEVDLVSKRALHPALKKRILSEAKQIF